MIALSVIALGLPLLAPPAAACGPDFPVRLLENRSTVLLAAPEGTFHLEAGHIVEPRTRDWPLASGFRRDQIAAGLTEEELGLVHAMAAAPSVEAALQIGAALPEELRLYGAGAHRYHADVGDRGRSHFAQVVALPAEERRRRGIWARYMLGRLAASVDEAVEHYEALRAEVTAGAADPMGLAVSSLGEEARRWLPLDRTRALALYAEQSAMFSSRADLSLRFVLRDMVAQATDDELAAWVQDPVTRRLLVVFLWTRGPREGAGEPGRVTRARLLEAIEAAGIDEVEHADELAALAYQAGAYESARAWAERAGADSPLAWWIRAKLALRDGDDGSAAAAYAKAAVAFPIDESWQMPLPTSYGEVYHRMPVRQMVHAEQGLHRLSRGDYVAALRSLLGAVQGGEIELGWRQGWEDAAHVAERVLTADELVAFVGQEGESLREDVRGGLRALLGRRLMREGRPAEAVGYFDDPALASQARAYADALARTERGGAVDRAEAWLEAAEIVRPGIDLFGTVGAPDYEAFDGVFERWSERSLVPDDVAWRGPDESMRVTASAAAPPVRFHYRQVASTHAEAAADLLPTDSQAFAVSLCKAAEYVMMRGPRERVDELYLRYVREGPLYEGSGRFGAWCPEPDFDGLRARMRAAWWRTWGPPGAVGLGLVLLIGAAWFIRRER